MSQTGQMEVGAEQTNKSLQGKVAIVTGASTGIGKAIAIEMAHRGASVVVNYIGKPDAAQDVVKTIKSSNGEALAIEADVSNSQQVTRMVAQTVSQFGHIDVLVNNAGVEEEIPFLDLPEAEWDKIIAVDLKGPFLCTQAAAREMAKRKKGTVVNISSVHEDLPFPGYAPYCAAKGGLRMLCRDLALELAKYNINIVNVAPGAIDTPINDATMKDPEKVLALKREIPLGRVGKPQDVAKLVCFLASDDASYITGTTVVIDGGLMHQTQSL
ncbi:MAG TPA: glucose 1-dehydrogenase [Candidatus Acidoferrales bacterium]|nr:glucose 1-dehydrogenase [Candidatus Acidoferrales bacterium]